MKILIVDDNKNNRMILDLLLEDYMDENEGVEFEVEEACDGLEAVELCREKDFDLVLMDIMMPNMDGIEATKIIRNEHKKIMIIAVSAVDDSERQKHIISNGAEDYISKPVNADIFNTRIGNYITLIEARNSHKKTNDKGINLFTKEIFSRYMKFMFPTEDALSEFWEYFLLESEEKNENMSDLVRTIFAIADTQVRLNIHSSVYVEESEDFKYFTLTKVDELPDKVVSLILKKNNLVAEYKIQDDKISFKIENKLDETTEIEEEEMLDPFVDSTESIVEPQVEDSEIIYSSSKDLTVYDYMDEDDLYDLEEYSNKLSSLMLIVGSGDITVDEATEIYSYLDRVGAILSTYSEIYPISQAISTLSSDMQNYLNEFVENSEALGPMCAAFSKDLTNWIEQSFHTGAPSADFMNDTIVVNCQTISSMLKMNEVSDDAGADDFDDIFDF